MLYYHGRTILLIRNPFSAIISAFKHIHFGFHSFSSISVKENILNLFKPENNQIFFSQKFRNFAAKSILKWRKIIDDWVILGDTLVIHYEDVQEDKMREIRRLLRFLSVEPDKDRLACLQYSKVDIFKRKRSKLHTSPYTPELLLTIKSQIDQVDSLLIRFGHPGIPYNKYKLF